MLTVKFFAHGAQLTNRDEQRRATRELIVRTSAELLMELGVAHTTTAEVQRRTGLSRGALLHHFNSREELLAATAQELIDSNRSAAQSILNSDYADDPVDEALLALHDIVIRPQFVAELSLWSAARSDDCLHAALQETERAARDDLYAVVNDAFGPDVTGNAAYQQVASLTVQFLRGLAVSQTLRADPQRSRQLALDWANVIRIRLDTDARNDTPHGGNT